MRKNGGFVVTVGKRQTPVRQAELGIKRPVERGGTAERTHSEAEKRKREQRERERAGDGADPDEKYLSFENGRGKKGKVDDDVEVDRCRGKEDRWKRKKEAFSEGEPSGALKRSRGTKREWRRETERERENVSEYEREEKHKRTGKRGCWQKGGGGG
ncbi:hypothetical protein RUM43_007706 [Polyplax serrata]|uniref:Uncharacterized protein n=1 Tax=Polyplax serrata TaxID=468196 RepID=A0AAN8Q6D3_POLSC